MAVISTIVTVPAGVTASNDIVIGTVSPPGELIVASGGSIVGTIVALGGGAVIHAGGTATGTTLQNDIYYGFTGGQYVNGGVAISTLVASGGIEAVAGGGVTSGALVLKGGTDYIGPFGFAVGMTVDGGSAVVEFGTNAFGTSVGTASGTTVTNGGLLWVKGGIDSHASVTNGGTIDVSSSGNRGTDSGTSVGSGGTMNVSSGGTASGTSVGSGGTLNVSAGGVVSALTIKDPNDPGVTAQANILSGGTVDGSTKINGGILTLDAGAVFQPHAALTIVNNGWLLLEQNSFQGTIKQFGGSDELDLAKIRFIGQETTETFTQTTGAGGLLHVADGSHSINLHLAGTYTTANVGLASDGAHGTLVSFVPNASLPGHG